MTRTLWGLDNVLVLGHRVHEADPSLVDVMIEATADDDDDPDWDVRPAGGADLSSGQDTPAPSTWCT